MRRLPTFFGSVFVLTLAACGSDTAAEGGIEAPETVSLKTAVARAGARSLSVPPDRGVAAGEELFGRIGCNGCHTIDGVGGIVGPNLSAVGARPSRDPFRWPTTEEYIRASLEGPQQYVVDGYTPDMPPPDLLGVSSEEIEALVSYLLTRTSE